MDKWLNYHHLYYFRMIASEGSIARASEKLRLGHPTLSAQLKQLEEKLGVALFERRHKKLLLTESGKIALAYAEEIFGKGAEMVEALNDRLTPAKTHLTLGALDSVPKHITYRLIDAAYASRDCTVTVLEGSDDELLRLLLSYRIDLMLSNHLPSVADGKKVRSRSLGKLPVIVCGSPRFKSLKQGFPRSLDRAPFVLPTRHSKLRHDIDHYFEANGLSPEVRGEIQDTALQKIMGTRGVGLVPLVEIAAKALLKNGDLIRIGNLEGVYEELFLVSCSRKFANPAAESLYREFSFPLRAD